MKRTTGLKNRIVLSAPIPTTQNFHRLCLMLDPVKYLEVFLHDEAPDSRALMDFGVTLRKETQALARLDDELPQFVRRCGIMNGNQPYDSLKVLQESLLEDYLEVHPPSGA